MLQRLDFCPLVCWWWCGGVVVVVSQYSCVGRALIAAAGLASLPPGAPRYHSPQLTHLHTLTHTVYLHIFP